MYWKLPLTFVLLSIGAPPPGSYLLRINKYFNQLINNPPTITELFVSEFIWIITTNREWSSPHAAPAPKISFHFSMRWHSISSARTNTEGARDSVVGWGTMLLGIFNWPNPSILTMALGLTQPLNRIIRNIAGGGGGSIAGPVRKTDNLTPIFAPIHKPGGDHRHLTTREASTACYKDVYFTLYFLLFTNTVCMRWKEGGYCS
jgi:hypothetical protein